MQPFSQYPDVMTIPEIAECLRVSASVVEELIDDRKLTYVTIGATKLVYKSDLITYLEKNRHMCYDASNEMHLDNCTEADTMPCSEREVDNMANRINQPVVINGEKHWITAKTAQEFADKVAALTGAVSCSETQQANKHPFDEYAWNWYYTYSEPNIATVTAVTYKRQIEKYLIPAFAELAVEEVTPDHIQRLFNSMETTKATKDKLRTVLNQILEAAIEDKIIASNPLKSKKVKITGTASKSTEPYSVSQMQYLAQHLDNVKKDQDRAFLAISIFHPLRPEEVLGLKGADIDRENMTITIRRAVTHPLRNQPEIKEVKTVGSARTITLSAQAMPHIPETHFTDFIFGGKKPASYTIVRGICRRIKKDVLFDENITPKRFRTTVLTDMYDQTKDIKLVQAAAGHATSAMTLKHYVKGRQTDERGAAAIEKLYTA